MQGNVHVSPNAYLATRRFECDGQGKLFLYSKLETPHSGVHPMNATGVEKLLAITKPLMLIGEPTVMRKTTNVPNVGKAFPTNQNLLHIRESAEERNPMAQ